MKKSRKNVGRGIINMSRIVIIPIAISISGEFSILEKIILVFVASAI